MRLKNPPGALANCRANALFRLTLRIHILADSESAGPGYSVDGVVARSSPVDRNWQPRLAGRSPCVHLASPRLLSSEAEPPVWAWVGKKNQLPDSWKSLVRSLLSLSTNLLQDQVTADGIWDLQAWALSLYSGYCQTGSDLGIRPKRMFSWVKETGLSGP